MSVFNPSTSDELRQVLLDARPGDVIQLLPQKYIGQFTLAAPRANVNANFGVIPAAGARNALPITLQGTKSADYQRFSTIVSRLQPHTAISITGGRWTVTGLVIRSKYYWDFNQVGVNIQGDGHVLEDLVFICNRFGVRINGDNNRIESIRVLNSKEGISILGSGNSVKDTVLSRILNDGIIVHAGSVGTNIQTTSVHMKKNAVRKNIGHHAASHPPIIKQGRSLSLRDGSFQTTLSSSIFHGVATILGVQGEISSCKFANLNLMSDQNNFLDTTIGNLHRVGDLEFTTFDDHCKLGMLSNQILTFV